MSDDNKVAQYQISAEPSGFVAGMEQAQAKAKEASKSIESSMSSISSSMSQITGVVKSVTGILGTLTAVMAGGAAFKEAIGASTAWTGEAKKLSMQLGITTERASVLMVAMRHMGMDSETISLAAGKMAKQLFTNSQAFEKLGVSIKDSNGQYRPTLDIMGEVNAKLKEIKNPIEQNIAGTQVYGKSWNEVRGVLKVTADEIKAAEQKTKDLGLVVGDEAVSQSKKYKESLNDMKLIMSSLEIQLGNVMLPAFVKLGSWLGGVGPVVGKGMALTMQSLGNVMETVGESVDALWQVVKAGFLAIGDLISMIMGKKAKSDMESFAAVLKAVEISFLAGKVGITVALEVIKGYVEALTIQVVRMAATIERALHADFSGAKRAWQTGTEAIEDTARKHAKNIADIVSAGRLKLDEIIKRPMSAGPEIKDKTITGGPTYDFDKPDSGAKEKSRMHEWEARLGADKEGFAKAQEIAGTAHEYSHQMERDYWKRILNTVTMSKEERAQVEKKYYAETALLRKDAFEANIAGEKAAMEAFKNNHTEREAIAQRIYQSNVQRYGADSKEARAAMAEVLKEQRAYAEQTLATNKVIAESRRNAELAGIDAAEQAAQLDLELHRITDVQMLELDQQFETKRYQIKMQALQQQQAAMRGKDEDPVALAQIQGQIEALEQQHQTRLQAIRNKSTLSSQSAFLSMYGSIESGMSRVIAGTLQGTMSIATAMRSMLGAVTNALIDMIAQQGAKWLLNQAMMLASSKVGAISQVTENAGVAGAAATASAAAIPMIGWTLAPEAGAAAAAAAMAYMPMASARGGYDIPAGINPIVQTHAREMILPEAQANAVRDMAAGGGGKGGTTNITIHAVDAAGVAKLFKENGNALVAALKNQHRKFAT